MQVRARQPLPHPKRPAAPSHALLPASAAARAIVRQMVNIVSNDMQPLGNLLTLKKVGAIQCRGHDVNEYFLWTRHRIRDVGDREDIEIAISSKNDSFHRRSLRLCHDFGHNALPHLPALRSDLRS